MYTNKFASTHLSDKDFNCGGQFMQTVHISRNHRLVVTLKINSVDDMVHEAIDRVACGWEVCIALLTRRSLEITTKFFDN